LFNFIVSDFHTSKFLEHRAMAEPCFLSIPSKPDAPISCTFFSGRNDQRTAHLIVFVNGLGLPASSWLAGISLLRSKVQGCPPILTYDRYGQGLTSARDPLDKVKGSHDFLDVVKDLHEIILSIATFKLRLDEKDVESGKLHLLLVGASIGGPIVRLYTQHHPGIIAGAIILDSNIANANYSDIWPDPDAPGFDPKTVIAPDCPTVEEYRVARNKLAAMFDLSVKNPESLDRSTGPSLLPDADAPKLVGPGGCGPFLSIVGHDPVTFANGSLEKMGTPKSLSMKFTNALVFQASST
jgi:pimeloyl-ACP methyl ester carboxylesterase